MKKTLLTSIALVILPLLLHLGAPAQESGLEPPFTVIRGAEQSRPVQPFAFDGDLRDLPKSRVPTGDEPVIEIPRRTYPGPIPGPEAGPPAQDRGAAGPMDPLLELQNSVAIEPSARAFTPPNFTFDGIVGDGVLPPDTVGDVGPNHYIQMVNGADGSRVVIHDKSGSGTPLVGPSVLDSLWTAGGACATGRGDPIVLYDHLADRWLMSEFATSGNHLCLYISKTADPVAGGWWLYDFTTPDFPDYPKYAVWPDAYYVSTNESTPAAYALDRIQMLSGLPATFQRFSVSRLSGFPFQSLVPSDLDGSMVPPAGAPNYFMRHRDGESHGGPIDPVNDTLEQWAFHVDWATPENSTFSGPTSITVSDFDSALCGLSSLECFAQPGTAEGLDPLREVIMWRLQYRNFGTHETLVGNFAVDVDGADHGGIRWFELRKSGAGPWTVFQEGTYAPDAHHRWMGSIGMDVAGNIALGYSVTSGTLFPSIRYTGRLSGDPLGTMTQGEGIIMAGGGSQTSGFNRWGDYSAMSVDPADDCTFWYTNEYYASTSTASWRTRIGSFRFDGCISDLSILKSDAPDPVFRDTNLTYTLTVDNNGPDNAADVTVTDTLPASASFVSATPDQGSCNQSAGVVTCNLGDIANGGSAGITIVVKPGATGLITNMASVEAAQFDPDADNNTATANTTVNAQADLDVNKTEDLDPAFRDAELTYTVTVTNNGPSNATGVIMTDPLPGSVTFISATPDQGSCNQAAGTVSCNLGTLSAGAGVDVEIVVVPTSEGALSNTASVTGAETDPVPGNNSEGENTAVNALIDLSVNKTDSPDPVVAGSMLTYTVTVSNGGPSTATGVTLTDTLPGSFGFDSASPGCSEAAGTVTCAIGSLPADQNIVLEIEVTPLASGLVFSNTVAVSGIETDSDTGNDSSVEDTSVTGISASPSSHFFGYVEPGGASAPRTFTITNSGTTGLAITGTVSLDPAQFPLQNDNCSGQNVAPSGSCTLEAVFSPTAPGFMNTSVRVTSNDPVLATLNVPLSGAQLRTLTVAKTGSGSGSVTSVPAGIDCGTTCQASYDIGTQVTLTPAPGFDSDFVAWSGDADCLDGIVTVSVNTACTASFALKTLPLSVALTGTGSGSVHSDPPGILCGTDCEEAYDFGAVVLLTAEAGDDSEFSGWGGGCSGSDPSAFVTITQAESCTAAFNLKTLTLSVTLEGPGSGAVTSTPGGIECGADCDETYSYGVNVILSSLPDANSSFAGWNGDADCTDGAVIMTQDRACTAVFAGSEDLDNSGRVDGFDLGRMGMAFGSTPADSRWDPKADLNGDFVVDELDVDILLSNFGSEK